MKILNAIYAAIGVVVAVVATTVGIINKTITPTKDANPDLAYLTPQPSDDTDPDNSGNNPVITLKNTQLGTRHSVSKEQVSVTSNADARWQSYDRPEDFPNMKQLPVQWITMKDGTRLAAYVTLPADASGTPITNQKFPVILMQSPYSAGVAGKVTNLAGGPDPELIKRGYAAVAVDVRGTGNSGGKWGAFDKLEQQDANEVVDWSSKQQWSDGKVGLYGVSYLGITSLLSAATQHPAIKAAFPIVPMGDAYRDILFNGGQLNTNFIPAWLGAITVLGALPLDQLVANPINGKLLALEKIKNSTEFQIPLFVDSFTGTEKSFDVDFWGERSLLEQADKIKIPTFVVGGTLDLFQRSEPLWREALKDHTTVKIFIGPWNHLAAAQLFPSLPKGNIPKLNHITLQWFDHYLKDMNNGAENLPNVTQWVHGHDDYVTTTDWPHPALQPDRLFLNKNGNLVNARTTVATGENFLIQAPIFGMGLRKLKRIFTE